ncbi:MAG TPA: TIGR03067 domain-containing protein [Candidatus Tectomicrobia bacterium]|nr:TIGR03067 domain-containing protein [Candidatus Tectomicrobia bacterium]
MERQALEGRWTVVSAEREGQPADDLQGNVLTIAGDRFTIAAPDGRRLHGGTVRVGGAGEATTIDFLHDEGALRGVRWLGIHRREGDTLEICDNAADTARPRPARFATAPESGYVLLAFRRSPSP